MFHIYIETNVENSIIELRKFNFVYRILKIKLLSIKYSIKIRVHFPQTISIFANNMQKLNLPEYQYQIRTINDRTEIFDSFRKRYIVLTPEEWVRQNFLHFLISKKGYPISLISVEKGLKVNTMQRRFDAVIFDSSASPRVLIEFKAPKVKISQETFDQAARYNLSLKVDFLIISNGLEHFCCHVDLDKNSINFLKDIPDYQEINTVNG